MEDDSDEIADSEDKCRDKWKRKAEELEESDESLVDEGGDPESEHVHDLGCDVRPELEFGIPAAEAPKADLDDYESMFGDGEAENCETDGDEEHADEESHGMELAVADAGGEIIEFNTGWTMRHSIKIARSLLKRSHQAIVSGIGTIAAIICHASEKRPNAHVDAQAEECADDWLNGENRILMSDVAHAKQANIRVKKHVRIKEVSTCTAVLMNRWAIVESFDRLCKDTVAKGGKVLCMTAACRYDETSLKVRANEVTNTQKAITNFSGANVTTTLRTSTAVHRQLVDDGTGPAKIVQTEWKYGLLLKREGQYVTFETDW